MRELKRSQTSNQQGIRQCRARNWSAPVFCPFFSYNILVFNVYANADLLAYSIRTSQYKWLSRSIFAGKNRSMNQQLSTFVYIVNASFDVSVFCSEDANYYDKTGRYFWPRVKVGDIAQVECRHGPRFKNSTGYAIRACSVTLSGHPYWEIPDTSECTEVRAFSQMSCHSVLYQHVLHFVCCPVQSS